MYNILPLNTDSIQVAMIDWKLNNPKTCFYETHLVMVF